MADISDNTSLRVAEQWPDMIALFIHSVNAARENGLLSPKPENFEANFVELVQRWAASPQYGISIDATTTSELHNVANFLADALFTAEPCADPKARLTENELDHLLNFVSLSCMIGAAAMKVSELPASRGYEPMLQEHGFNPISARGLAHLLVKSGSRRAKEERLRPTVVKAIRGLATSHFGKTSQDQARYLLQVADDSSIVDTICCEVGLREMDLLPLLQALVDGEPHGHQKLSDILQKLRPALSVPRGRKRSAASAAHEFALEGDLPAKLGCSAYTLDDVAGDFTDPLTLATRLEFGDPTFDPRPAHRRLKRRRLAESGSDLVP
jgi:hypothetical protein